MVRVPLIAECSINLEHRLEWHRSLYEKSNCHLFEGRVVHLVVDDRVMVTNPIQRMRSMDLM
jgi:flavin reductase (DIM6/NTAB) family NADH-FMN oxidoreductase RutF